MKRWTAVLLLVLSVFTLAPRTSINPGGELVLTRIISRTEIRPGSAVTYVLQARNRTNETMENVQVQINVGWDAHHEDLRLVVSKGCNASKTETGFSAICSLGSLAPGEQRVVRLSARPVVAGRLTFTALGVSSLGPVPAGAPVVVQVGSRG